MSRLITVSCCLILLFIFPYPVSGDACFRPELYGYRFFNPLLAGYDSEFSPLFATFGDIYAPFFEDPAIVQKRENLEEWHERYCENVAITDLDQLIYGRTENRLRELLRTMQQEGSRLADLSPQLRTNGFARHLLKYRCEEVVSYLLFAKDCERVVQAPANSFATQTPVGNTRRRLIERGLKSFVELESHYVRLRYAFQLVRLAHYEKDYPRVLELYDYLMPKIDADPSILYHWIEGHRAAALRNTGEGVEANYLYSRIFAECPSKRESAFQSFLITNEEDWHALLIRCNNDKERANLHVLRAQSDKARLIAEMKDIYRLDPGNKALEILLVREIQRLEIDLLGREFNPHLATNRRAYGLPRPEGREKLIALQEFVTKVNKEGQSSRPLLWELAEGYLYLLGGDYFYAQRSFNELLGSNPEDSLEQQVNVFDQVLDVLLLEELTDSSEQAYFRLLQDDEFRAEYPDFRRLVNDKFRQVYRVTGQRAKAFLMRYELGDLRYNLDIDLINELREVALDTNDNTFLRQLIMARSDGNAGFDLIDMQATYHLQRGRLRLANEIYQEIPTENWNDYGNFTPFEAFLNDRVNVSVMDASRKYNKGELMARMLELEELAETAQDPDEAARRLFTLGLVYYNISYFSYGWKVADYFRSGINGARAARQPRADFVFSSPESPVGNYENMSMDRALSYFERARLRAYDAEIAARATFWAAKCERNTHYVRAEPRTFGYFGILRDYYDETDFYQRAIDECRTFSWFVGR